MTPKDKAKSKTIKVKCTGKTVLTEEDRTSAFCQFSGIVSEDAYMSVRFTGKEVDEIQKEHYYEFSFIEIDPPPEPEPEEDPNFTELQNLVAEESKVEGRAAGEKPSELATNENAKQDQS
jgi:hypothetical protein